MISVDKDDEIFARRIEPERKSELPFSAENIAGACSGDRPDCIMIRVVLKKMIWVVILSESPNAIRATILGFDAVTGGENRACRAFFACRRLRQPQKGGDRAGTRL